MICPRCLAALDLDGRMVRVANDHDEWRGQAPVIAALKQTRARYAMVILNSRYQRRDC